MCIANVIPSHQMAWVSAKAFFFKILPHLLPCSPSIVPLLYSAPLVLFLSSAPSFKSFFFSFSPPLLDFPHIFHLRLLLSLSFLPVVLLLYSFFRLPLPFTSSLSPSLHHHVILSRTHYHQSMAELLTQHLWLQSSILQC